MNEPKHTLGPWYTDGSLICRDDCDGRTLVAEAKPLDYAGNCTEEEKANAEVIVRACNSHYELLKIAEAYRNLLKTSAHTEGEVATYHHIVDVLKRAKGEV